MPHILLTAVLLLGQVDGLPPLGGARPASYYPEPNAAQGIVQPAAHESPATSWTSDRANSLSGRAPLPLTRPSAAGEGEAASRAPPSAGRSIVTVVSSLAIVLGLFFAAAWLMRRGAPAGSTALPSEVVQVLGRAALSAKQQMQLVRIGDKLVLLAVWAGGGADADRNHRPRGSRTAGRRLRGEPQHQRHAIIPAGAVTVGQRTGGRRVLRTRRTARGGNACLSSC